MGKKEDDLATAEHWLEQTEREDAYQWWVTVSKVVSPTVLTWDFFLAEFKKKYNSHVYLEARRREFLTLRQRQLMVSEYEREFVRLSRYAWETMTIEADRCHKFEDALNDNIRLLVMTLRLTDFSQLVVAALNVERRPASKTVEWPEARVAPRVYAMRAQEEPDLIDVLRGIQIDGLEEDILVTNPLGHKVIVDYQLKRITLKIVDGDEKETVYKMQEDGCRTN
ncbi:uncharacterized protein LOC131174599 [Hevea brasiliensis]|uniref:uncharacterized protein LOC131174599 n=1 Tax=Hevea brasiliensis TaxID=3981 RepID=UPI0025F08F77|nr:uncharacterized protein LOC131174599 [Hevea brasiliensis]